MKNTFKVIAATFVVATGFAFAAGNSSTTAPVASSSTVKKLSSKEAREHCLKDNAKLHGSELKKCIAEKRS